MSNDAFEMLLASLPVPGVDKMPPPVMASKDDLARAAEDRKEKDDFLDPKTDTEERVKYALGSVCGMRLVKDGDFETIGGGRTIWRKKIADYVGSTPGVSKNYHTYVEVKGVSPGNRFNFSRLDKPNTPRQPSQHEKLTKAWEDGNLVFLAIGWWIAPPGVEPVIVESGGKKFTKWNRADLELEIDLIPWDRWLEFYSSTKARSMTKTRAVQQFTDCLIRKVGNRWKTINHWWNNRYTNGLIGHGERRLI